MYCPSCHKNFPATASRCGECGTWLKTGKSPNPQAETVKKVESGVVGTHSVGEEITQKISTKSLSSLPSLKSTPQASQLEESWSEIVEANKAAAFSEKRTPAPGHPASPQGQAPSLQPSPSSSQAPPLQSPPGFSQTSSPMAPQQASPSPRPPASVPSQGGETPWSQGGTSSAWDSEQDSSWGGEGSTWGDDAFASQAKSSSWEGEGGSISGWGEESDSSNQTVRASSWEAMHDAKSTSLDHSEIEDLSHQSSSVVKKDEIEEVELWSEEKELTSLDELDLVAVGGQGGGVGASVKFFAFLLVTIIVFFGGLLVYNEYEKKGEEEVLQRRTVALENSLKESLNSELGPKIVASELEALFDSLDSLRKEAEENETDLDSIDSKVLEDSLVRLVELRLQLNQPFDAEKAAQRLKNQFPNLTEHQGLLAQVEEQKQKFNRVKAQNKLNFAKKQIQEKNFNAAINAANLSMKLFDENGGTQGQLGATYYVLGQAYMSARDFASAEYHLRKATRLDPSNSAYKALFAKAESKMERKAGAYASSAPAQTSASAPKKSTASAPSRSSSGGVRVIQNQQKKTPRRAAPARRATSRAASAPAVSTPKKRPQKRFRSSGRRSSSSKRKKSLFRDDLKTY